MTSSIRKGSRETVAPPIRLLLFVAMTLTAVACSESDGQGASGATTTSDRRSGGSTAEVTVADDAMPSTSTSTSTFRPRSGLPVRDGPREETTNGVPHVQIAATPVPALDAELRRRAFSLPGVEERESAVSLPGARALWLSDELELARPEVLQAGREFAHIHPDGSLHVWLPVDRAFEVAETKWGEFHPWVGRSDFWDGLVMVYTPETPEGLEIITRLIVDAYNHVTGADVDPSALS